MNLTKIIELLEIAKCPDPDCDGYGVTVVQGSEAGCCNQPTDSGECCGDPVAVQTQEQSHCEWCHDRADALDKPSLLVQSTKADIDDIDNQIPI